MNSKITSIFILIIFLQFNMHAQKDTIEGLQIIDISQKQIDLMNTVKNEPINKRNSFLLDSIYKPYSYLWKGYLGSESDFINWINDTAFGELENYHSKAAQIDLTKLNRYFFKTAHEMEIFTGKKPKGKWYIFFGPKWTNLGGIGHGTMLIDLANESNKSFQDIKIFFPHEINHQIYSSTIKRDKNAVLYRILDEGFACYVSYLFHNGETLLSEELGFTEAEYKFCVANEKELIDLLKNSYTSNSKQLSDQFADRSYRFFEKFPGGVGYYIGFRVVEEFIKRNGKDSWKNIYEMVPEKVLEKSKIMQETIAKH